MFLYIENMLGGCLFGDGRLLQWIRYIFLILLTRSIISFCLNIKWYKSLTLTLAVSGISEFTSDVASAWVSVASVSESSDVLGFLQAIALLSSGGTGEWGGTGWAASKVGRAGSLLLIGEGFWLFNSGESVPFLTAESWLLFDKLSWLSWLFIGGSSWSCPHPECSDPPSPTWSPSPNWPSRLNWLDFLCEKWIK